jgi:hypothetical protein
MLFSQSDIEYIVSEEIGSEAYYIKALRSTCWPGYSSGVTIGIGYDIGQTPVHRFREDWQGHLPVATIDALAATCGVTGPAAKPLAAQLRSIVDVPLETAKAVFAERSLPYWVGKTRAALPGFDDLPSTCQAVLVSLTFNRGTSYGSAGDRYREMRAIKAHVASRDYDKIPGELRSMARLWAPTSGVYKRRFREATRFEGALHMTQPVDGALRYGARGYEVEALQTRLAELGYPVGQVDGKFGTNTRNQVLAFQADRNLPTTGVVDDATRAALREDVRKPVSEARENATVEDLRDAGSTTVREGDRVGLVGKILLALGIGGGGAEVSGVRETVEQVSALRPMLDTITSLWNGLGPLKWGVLVVLGWFAWTYGRGIVTRRLADHRSGANMGR